jgi:hypothetical protein
LIERTHLGHPETVHAAASHQAEAGKIAAELARPWAPPPAAPAGNASQPRLHSPRHRLGSRRACTRP